MVSETFLEDFSLSGEGVASSYFVVARRPVSRHGSEFDTSEGCRFCELGAAGLGILGALECLQTGRAALRSCLRASARAAELFEGECEGSGAV